jgi:hypothetical protein
MGEAEMKKSFYGPIELKSNQKGEFTAIFATLGVIDHDQDVTRPGAFIEGQETLIEPWNHRYDCPPVGKGVIHERGNKAIVEGKFFLDTVSGKEHYLVVKELGPLQQWSYTFEILKSSPGHMDGQDIRFLEKLDTWGIAPVSRGAGIDTGTQSIKASSFRNWMPLSKSMMAIRDEISNLMPPDGGELSKLLNKTIGDLQDQEIADLSVRIQEGGSRVIDEWIRQLRSEGHSDQWIQAVLSIEIQGLEQQLSAQYPNLQYQSGEAHRIALAILSRPFRPGVDRYPIIGAEFRS